MSKEIADANSCLERFATWIVNRRHVFLRLKAKRQRYKSDKTFVRYYESAKTSDE
jgi:hypothetical protein